MTCATKTRWRGPILLVGLVSIIIGLAPQPAARSAGPAPEPPRSGCTSNLTGNAYLLLPSVEASKGIAVSCAVPSRGPAAVKLAELIAPGGVRIAVGHAGQIYGIRVPGVPADLIAAQRIGNPYVDEVLQTTGSNVARHAASPRALAQRAGDYRRAEALPGWDMHQAGAYARGPLAGHPPVYAPLLYEHFDAAW